MKEKEEKEKERAKGRKGGEEKKSNGCTLSVYNSYFRVSFWPKKRMFEAKGPFGDKVFKNPARYIF